MKRLTTVFFVVIFVFTTNIHAQEPIVQEGEFGIGIGAGHYFGDLNTRARLNRPKIAAGIFFFFFFGN